MIDEKDRQELRRRCQTDLYFLAKDVLGKDLEEQPHREMCASFVQKNPDVLYTELTEIKERLLMTPRGSFKSTLNVIDCVQWTICYPMIRILVITAEKTLSEAFAEEFRNYFIVRDSEGPTLFQQLFPEFCIAEGTKSPATEFTTPARPEYKKEPTLWCNSIGSNLPGWHTDILVCDDIVTNLNSATDEQAEKIIAGYNFALALVDPGGYVQVIGTPYRPNDLYSFLQKNSQSLSVYARPAWTVRPEAKRKSEEERTKADYILFFPKRLTYEYLKKKQKYDPVTFESQYLINSRGSSTEVFTEELMRNVVIPWQSLPQDLNYYAAWDFGGGKPNNPRANSTCGIVAGVDTQGRLYIVEVLRGRFKPLNIAQNVADFIRRYPLQITAIEDAAGATFLEPLIDQECKRLGVEPKLHWLVPDRKKDAKYIRIKALVMPFDQGRIFFSDKCQNLEEAIQCFIDYTGSKNKEDDVPDCLSFFPRFVLLMGKTQEEPDKEKFQKAWERLQRESLYDMIFPSHATPAPAEPEPEPPVIDDYFALPMNGGY